MLARISGAMATTATAASVSTEVTSINRRNFLILPQRYRLPTSENPFAASFYCLLTGEQRILTKELDNYLNTIFTLRLDQQDFTLDSSQQLPPGWRRGFGETSVGWSHAAAVAQ
jgi:hypothetical protein